VERDDAPTANTDNSFSTLELSHFLQATLVVEEGTIFSKVVPHSRHLNSKSGIDPPDGNIAKPAMVCNRTAADWEGICSETHRRCIFLGFFGCSHAKMS
jgi:hypothetical protein